MLHRLRVLLLVGTALYALSMGGCSRQNQNPTNQGMTEITQRPVPTLSIVDLPPVDLGQPSAKEGLVVTVFGTTVHPSLGDFTPNAGNIYLVADVQLENTNQDPIAFSFLHFALTDANGKTYQPAHGSADYAPPPALSSGELAKGDRARGSVVLEIPTEVTSGIFQYVNEQSNAEIWYRFQVTWK